MDDAKRRQRQRWELASLRTDVESFSDDELDKLYKAGYTSLERLRKATRDGLSAAGLLPGAIDDVLGAWGYAAYVRTNEREAQAAKHVTVLFPLEVLGGYMPVTFESGQEFKQFLRDQELHGLS
ncbi:hypothetical protein GPECTOR_431g303 [Gonium pectorale]|uniref:Uncharacterized protein n=1 Tax=Gonium pectorale TaxID=33097 RepID=A0A150FV68_GONPE|nr:hypothetical protein GPECTOR_431g303 [Gonium pectorale]|eukprot:KXZ41496.1 hypothetical protein GPECTOR_431g303 [Gonium pectorale]